LSNFYDFTDDELLELALERMQQQTEMFEEEIDMETCQDNDIFIAGKAYRNAIMNMM
jgi:hypothetical protein